MDIQSLATHESGHIILAAAWGRLPDAIILDKVEGRWVSLTQWPTLTEWDDDTDAMLYAAVRLAGTLNDPPYREIHIEDRHAAERICHELEGGYIEGVDWLLGELVSATRKVLDDRREYLDKVRDALITPGGPHATLVAAAEAMVESPHVLTQEGVLELIEGMPKINLSDFDPAMLRLRREITQQRELTRKRTLKGGKR